MDALRLEDVDESMMSKQEKRDLIRDMVTRVIENNTTPEPAEDNQTITPTTAATTTVS